MPKRSAAEDEVTAASSTAKRAKGDVSANGKKAADGKAPISTSTQEDDNGDRYWELSAGGMRRATVNNFKGTWMVNLREYYEANGEKKPGKKGISLPVDQFAALLEVLPQIESTLKEAGVDLPRPRYGADGAAAPAARTKEEEDDGLGEADDKVKRKENHEATSDEDEK